MSNSKPLLLRTLALFLSVALIISLIPVVVLSFANSPSYDDYAYTLHTHTKWTQTRSLWLTLKEAVSNAVSAGTTRKTNYSSSFLCAFQPTLFDESSYWMSTVCVLASLLYGLAIFTHLGIVVLLKGSREAFWCVFSALSITAIQFVPYAKETFFWHSGGIVSAVLWALMVVRFSLFVQLLFFCNNAKKKAALTILLFALTFVVGGAEFSISLFAIVLDTVLLLLCFCKKSKSKWFALFFELMLFGVLFFIIGARAEFENVAATDLLKAVVESVYLGVGLIGSWCNIRTAAFLALLIAVAAPCLSRCGFSFRLPLFFTAFTIGVFCLQVIPFVYAGHTFGEGVAVNGCYFTFLLLIAALAVYWTGWVQQRYPSVKALLAEHFPSKALSKAAIAGILLMAVFGTISWKPDHALSYGPQNTISGSAFRSLLNGEAEAFQECSRERMRILRDESLECVELTLLPKSPFLFMGDSLQGENQEQILQLFEDYFQKQSVTVTKEE